LQAHSSLKTIKKKLVRKVLDAIKKMAETEVKCEDKEGEVRQECMWVGLGVSYPKMLVFQARGGFL
jgi:hypothetical protein